MNIIKKFISKYLNNGISDNNLTEINKKIWISNAFAFYFGLSIPIYIPFLLLGNMKPNAYSLIPLTIFYISIPLINFLGLINLSRFLMIFIAHCFVGSFTITLKLASGVHLWFFLTLLYQI